jgi:acyl carrier protein
VLARRTAAGPPSLEAFVTFGRAAEPTVTELRSWLKQRLPPERVPASFVVLDALPLTSEGAPDRSALARLGVSGEGEGGAHSPPRTETERRLAAIWQETLGREAVSVGDNFFDLGGHSLLSVRVVARVEKDLGVRLDPRDLIFQSLEQLAAFCEARLETAEESR